MAKASRDKGRRGELEFVRMMTDNGFDAERISEAGLALPDVLVEHFAGEIKRRHADAQLSARQIERHIEHATADFLAWRFDHGRWFVAMPVATFIELLQDQKGNRRVDRR